jgi:tetratricopeptide (TPR) repeat protein
MARLDRLSEGKTVVQTAAVFGRRFGTEPLRQTLELEKAPFGKAIAEPVEARILVAEGEAQAGTMLFRHALVQQAAYEGLARRQRQQLHARIASLLLEHEPGLADTEPETLARHFAGAGKYAEAVTYLISAGKKATERAALSHLENLPEGRARDTQEVLLRALLGGALMATRGFAAPEVYDAFARARELCIELGDSPMFCSCLYGLFTVAASRSNKDEAMALAAEMLATFGEVPVPSWQIAAHFANGVARFFAGEFDAAEVHFGKAIEIYTPDQHALLVEQFGDDLTEFSMCYQHWLHLLRGEIDASAKVHAQAEAMANALKNKNAQARSIAFLMGRMLELEVVDKVAELAPQVIEISTTQGYPYWACAGQIGLGWTMARAGHEDGLLPITGSLDFFDMIGQRNPQTFWRSSLIAAHTALGQRDAAIAAADTALEMSRSGLDCAFEALIVLRRGQAEMLAPADTKAAEASFSQAIELASAQGAYLYGLLAATERAALLIDQGREGDEGGTLAQITARIESSEGFPALTRAQDLLGQL